MSKTGRKNVVSFSISLPRMLYDDLQETLAEMEKEKDLKFTRSGLIQVLIMRFLIARQEVKANREKANNKENKEEN